METISGTSPVVEVENGYSNNGGIALYAASDNDTVTGGSMKNPDGSYFDAYQILWTITRVDNGGTYEYSGGITGNYGWYFDEPTSPFYGSTIEAVAEEAYSTGYLNSFFSNWLENTDSDDKYTFLHEVMQNAKECLHYT